MTSPSLPTRLEAILYLKGRPVSIGELAELADADRRSVEEALVALTASYAQRDSALEVVEQRVATGCSCARAWAIWSKTCCR